MYVLDNILWYTLYSSRVDYLLWRNRLNGVLNLLQDTFTSFFMMLVMAVGSLLFASGVVRGLDVVVFAGSGVAGGAAIVDDVVHSSSMSSVLI